MDSKGSISALQKNKQAPELFASKQLKVSTDIYNWLETKWMGSYATILYINGYTSLNHIAQCSKQEEEFILKLIDKPGSRLKLRLLIEKLKSVTTAPQISKVDDFHEAIIPKMKELQTSDSIIKEATQRVMKDAVPSRPRSASAAHDSIIREATQRVIASETPLNLPPDVVMPPPPPPLPLPVIEEKKVEPPPSEIEPPKKELTRLEILKLKIAEAEKAVNEARELEEKARSNFVAINPKKEEKSIMKEEKFESKEIKGDEKPKLGSQILRRNTNDMNNETPAAPHQYPIPTALMEHPKRDPSPKREPSPKKRRDPSPKHKVGDKGSFSSDEDDLIDLEDDKASSESDQEGTKSSFLVKRGHPMPRELRTSLMSDEKLAEFFTNINKPSSGTPPLTRSVSTKSPRKGSFIPAPPKSPRTSSTDSKSPRRNTMENSPKKPVPPNTLAFSELKTQVVPEKEIVKDSKIPRLDSDKYIQPHPPTAPRSYTLPSINKPPSFTVPRASVQYSGLMDATSPIWRQPPTHRGTLLKRSTGLLNSKPKERFFVLQDGNLYWYESEYNNKKPLGMIILAEPGLSLRYLKDSCSLEIITNKKTYLLSSNQPKQIADWSSSEKESEGVIRENDRLLTVLRMGAIFQKYKHNKPKKRMIWVSAAMNKLYWGDLDKHVKGSISTSELLRVEEGCPSVENKEISLTVVGVSRTLELETTSHRHQQEWLSCLRLLIQKYGKKNI